MNINSPITMVAGLTDLEKSGVLMSHLLHELTNCLSVLAGHVQLIESLKTNPDRLSDSLASIKWASDSLGELIERYADLRRQIPHGAVCVPVAELIAGIRQGPMEKSAFTSVGAPGWQVVAPEKFSWNVNLEPRWIRFALWELVRHTQAAEGQIEIFTPRSAFDSRGLKTLSSISPGRGNVHLVIRWQSAQPAMTEQDLFKPPTLDLALIVGIVRWVIGQLNYAFVTPRENRIWMSLPAQEQAQNA